MRMPSVGRALLVFGCSVSLAACSSSHEKTSLAPVATTAETAVQVAIIPTIVNPGFELEWEAWDEFPESSDFTAISDDAHSGSHSAKITDNGGRFEQAVVVQPNTSYQISAFIRGTAEIGVRMPNETVSSDSQGDDDAWQLQHVTFNSGDAKEVVIFGAYLGGEARLDDFVITPIGGS